MFVFKGCSWDEAILGGTFLEEANQVGGVIHCMQGKSFMLCTIFLRVNDFSDFGWVCSFQHSTLKILLFRNVSSEIITQTQL